MSLLPVGFGSAAGDYEITDSLRLRDSASASLTRTPSTAPTNAKKFTLSVWVKLGIVNNYGYIYNVEPSNYTRLYTYTDGKMYFDLRISNTNYTTSPTRVFRDPSAWYHIVWAVDTTQATASDRVSIYINGVKETSFSSVNYPAQNGDTLTFSTNQNNIGQYNTNAHHFDGYLTEFHGIDGQALDADDFGQYDSNGTWKAKQYTGTYGTNGFYLPMKPTTQAELQNTVLYAGNTNEQSIDGVGYAPDFVWIKNRTGANNHYLYDTVRGTDRALQSQSTSAESVGAQQLTSFDTDGFTVPYDVSGYNNYAGRSYVAWTWDAGDNQTSTGISSVLYVGQGVAQSVKGFGFSPDLILFKNRASASPLLIDSVRGPSQELQTNSTSAETSNGVTRIKSIDSDGFTLADTTVSSLNTQNNNYVAWGWDAGDGDPVSNTDGSITSTVKASDATGFSIVSYTGNGTSGATIGHGLSSTPKMIIVKNRTTAGADWPVYHEDAGNTGALYLNTTAGFATDSTRWNNTSPTSTVFTVGNGQGVNHNSASLIAYCFSEVSGISKIDSYTGTGSSGNAITGLGFRPGFVMIKSSSIGSQSWHIYDGSRNPFNPVTLRLHTNSSSAEDALRPLGDFNSDGFTINSTQAQLNQNGATYIYIAFKGSYSDYVSPLNDDGSIDSRVKANTSKGFSIVSYTGTNSNSTVGHGLGVAPSMVICKNRTAGIGSGSWPVWHTGLSSGTSYLFLNSTAAQASGNNNFTSAPSSTVLNLGTSDTNNTATMIAYCFAEVAGYSKFGSYTGTGSSGNAITGLGFQPAWLMIKETTSTGSWAIVDTTRSPNYDAQGEYLWANLTSATGGASAPLTFDSDGFTINSSDSDTNSSGQTYIYMAFADTRDAKFNFDASGNKNNWIPNNINSNAESESTYDLMKDTPSLVDENAANFATLNPVDSYASGLSNGNLTFTNGSGAAYKGISTFVIEDIADSQKYYVEYTSDAGYLSGIVTTSNSGSASNASYSDIRGYYSNGNKYTGTSASSYGGAFTSADKLAMLIGDGKLEFFKNNVSQGVAFTGLTGSWKVATVAFGAAGVGVSYNFGQRPFAYTPPAGSKKLNTFNLPDSTIEDGSDYFNTVLYTGNDVNPRTIDTELTPDFVWIKTRSDAQNHALYDVLRGDDIALRSNTNAAESQYGTVEVALVDSGFTTDVPSGTNSLNFLNRTYAAWNWKANGSGSSNTDGSVTSTVSANTTAGFSIVGFTSPSSGSFTIGHGLSASPDLIIMKRRASNANWGIFHSAVCTNEDKYLIFNTNALISYTDYWGTALPTSTVFGANVGASAIASEAMIAYCWRAVEGYSSFGSYTGNGNSDGTFVYTGFRPAFVMVKRTDASGANWTIVDDKRNTHNPETQWLYANVSDAEANPNAPSDFLSNGFKQRSDGSYVNASGGTYIYMAFAENPFKNALAR